MKNIKIRIAADNGLDTPTIAAVFSLLWAVAGIYGFIYEIIFYYFNGGMEYVYWRGSCFGPWISIYGLGAFVIYFLAYRFKAHPALVCLAGGLGCGAFELASGAAMFYISGHRGWDYNSEILNFGNIGGFICLRSVIAFGLSSLVLIYVLLPLLIWFSKKWNKTVFMTVSYVLGAAFLLDIIYNLALAPALGTLTANEFYQGLGLHIINYY